VCESSSQHVYNEFLVFAVLAPQCSPRFADSLLCGDPRRLRRAESAQPRAGLIRAHKRPAIKPEPRNAIMADASRTLIVSGSVWRTRLAANLVVMVCLPCTMSLSGRNGGGVSGVAVSPLIISSRFLFPNNTFACEARHSDAKDALSHLQHRMPAFAASALHIKLQGLQRGSHAVAKTPALPLRSPTVRGLRHCRSDLLRCQAEGGGDFSKDLLSFGPIASGEEAFKPRPRAQRAAKLVEKELQRGIMHMCEQHM
jgi:hypothetical protein